MRIAASYGNFSDCAYMKFSGKHWERVCMTIEESTVGMCVLGFVLASQLLSLYSTR